MKAELTGKSKRDSLYGGTFHYLYFQGEDGKFVALPMDDMLPPLPREEFEENMRIIND